MVNVSSAFFVQADTSMARRFNPPQFGKITYVSDEENSGQDIVQVDLTQDDAGQIFVGDKQVAYDLLALVRWEIAATKYLNGHGIGKNQAAKLPPNVAEVFKTNLLRALREELKSITVIPKASELEAGKSVENVSDGSEATEKQGRPAIRAFVRLMRALPLKRDAEPQDEKVIEAKEKEASGDTGTNLNNGSDTPEPTGLELLLKKMITTIENNDLVFDAKNPFQASFKTPEREAAFM